MQENRPPYIEFERRLVEDRQKSLEQGIYVAKEVDFIIIVPAGSEGKTRSEQVYSEWLAKIRPQTGAIGGVDGHYMAASRFPADWVQKIENQYRLWKQGEEMEVEGTPLRNWPVISPGQLKMCTELHILSVEMLASAADDTIERLGMGGFNLRQRARDWVSQANDKGLQNAAQLEAARAELAAKDVRLKSLEEQVRVLQGQLSQLLSQTKQEGKERVLAK